MKTSKRMNLLMICIAITFVIKNIDFNRASVPIVIAMIIAPLAILTVFIFNIKLDNLDKKYYIVFVGLMLLMGSCFLSAYIILYYYPKDIYIAKNYLMPLIPVLFLLWLVFTIKWTISYNERKKMKAK